MKRSQTSKSKLIKNIFLLATFLGIIIVAYSIYQYNQGLSIASDGQFKDDGAMFDSFKGPEPEFGEINILLIGSDTRGEGNGQSDTLMIAHYNQKSHRFKIASIMRDTYVDIPDYGKHKINAAFAIGGPELVRKTIKQNFDIDVNYYAVVDFEGFPKIVDIVAPNGIEVGIPYEMSYGIEMTLHPGKQILHGNELLGYVRFRHDRLSDFGRVERQQEVLSKIKEQATTIHSLVNLPKMLGVADAYIDTNVDASTILAIGKDQIAGKSKPVETIRIPINGSYVNERVNVGAVLKIDFNKNKQALTDFLAEDTESNLELE